MTVLELRDELRRRRVDSKDYILEGMPTDTPADGAIYVVRTADGWDVGAQERGVRELLMSFPDEDAACAFALEQLTRPQSSNRPWYLRWT